VQCPRFVATLRLLWKSLPVTPFSSGCAMPCANHSTTRRAPSRAAVQQTQEELSPARSHGGANGRVCVAPSDGRPRAVFAAPSRGVCARQCTAQLLSSRMLPAAHRHASSLATVSTAPWMRNPAHKPIKCAAIVFVLAWTISMSRAWTNPVLAAPVARPTP